ncbi:MAG: glycosyltransferase [Amphritea sp.]|nr:glycosyltransferase [Amphritea sp.]
MTIEEGAKPSIAIVTTAFDVCDNIWKDYFSSLQGQTRKDFDVVMVNDGFTKLGEVREMFPDLSIREFSPANSIARNRQKMIELVKSEYVYAVFCDFDDFFSEDRVLESVNALSDCHIVLNNLSIYKEGSPEMDPFFTELDEFFPIDSNLILQKNFFGFSNTAMRCESIPNVDFCEELVAVDWYFFFCVILDGVKARYINKVLTYYRQYDASLATPEIKDVAQVRKEIDVKLRHYKALSNISKDYFRFYEILSGFKRLDDNKLSQLLEDMPAANAWWSILEVKTSK